MKRTIRRDSPGNKRFRRNFSPIGRPETNFKVHGILDQGRLRPQRQNFNRRLPRQNSPSLARSARDFGQGSFRRDQQKGYNVGDITYNRSSQRNFVSSSSRPSDSNRNNERYNQATNPERLLQGIGTSGKIDPVFAAAAAAALNINLIPGAADFSNFPSGVSRNLLPSSNNSSATVAAVAAAAMNAAALAAALGGGNANLQNFSRFNMVDQLSNYRDIFDRRSPEKRSYNNNNRGDYSHDNSAEKRSYRDTDRQSDRSMPNRYPYHMDHKEPEDDPTATRTLFIGNLPPDIRESDLRDIFERYGVLEDVDIKRHLQNSPNNAYAFLRFINLNMAHRAKLNMSGKMIGQYTCKIGYGKVSPTRCLWIGGLGPWIKYPQFASLVERMGTPEKIIWPSGKNYAHILLPNVETAVSVASTLRGYPLGGNSRKLRIDFTDESHMIRDPMAIKRRAGRQQPNDSKFQPQSSRSFRDNQPNYIGDRQREHRTKRHLDDDDRKNEQSSNNRRRISTISPSQRKDRSHSPLSDSVRQRNRRSPDSKYSRDFSNEPSHSPGYNTRTGSVTPCGSQSPSDVESKRGTGSVSPGLHSVKQCIDTTTTIEGLAACLPTSWKAVFVLKKSNFACNMHIVRGDESLVDQFISRRQSSSALLVERTVTRGPPKTPPEDGSDAEEDDTETGKESTSLGRTSNSIGLSDHPDNNLRAIDDDDLKQPFFRISQRMKMDPLKLDDVNQRIRLVGNQGYCVLLALPVDEESFNGASPSQLRSVRPLRDLINYLATKDAAGVVLLNPLSTASEISDDQSPTGVLHVLPPCDFAYELLAEKAVCLQKPPSSEKFLVILLIRSYGLL